MFMVLDLMLGGRFEIFIEKNRKNARGMGKILCGGNDRCP